MKTHKNIGPFLFVLFDINHQVVYLRELVQWGQEQYDEMNRGVIENKENEG